MAMIKCKMCGGDLTLNEGQTVAECEYCGSMQTVPVADDEKKLTLFARANRLRTACEFDKAAGVYESIVADFPEEAEAYWGLVLCKYGIEYVDDPATGRKIPTCHRSSFESVMEDSDFEQTLENADAVSRKIYREEAKQIEELRRGIVAVSNNEEPYDIFICYKETDEKGERTIDSVIAQDVYGALTDKGYRVFFSRISLEDKLGLEYEPYIFAALNSAKVMLAFGTDYEYYNAVWVKNEWGRYLKLMAKDKTKHLIPCFKGIDAYDMPKEFARLQAQDMGKVGAVQDLLRGIEKLLPKQENAAAATQETAVFSGGNPNVAPLMERGYMFLEDGDWDSADAYFEKVLDQEPKNARAYVGKLMAELRVHEMEQLAEQATPFDEEPDYQKAIRFADSSLRDALESYLAVVKNRMEEERIAREKQEEEERIAREKREEEERRRKAAFRKKITEAEGLISAGYRHTGGLRSDGTVVAVGENKNGQCDVSGWADIVAISAGYYRTIGLKSNGTVTAAGESKYGQCDVSGWTDIVAIRAGLDHTVGLRSDGTVVAVGENKNGQCDVSGWTDIVAIRIGNSYTVGLKSDGTLVAVGKNEEGQCNLSDWTDIVAISAGYRHTVGLRSDGTVAAVGGNACGQCKVSGWTDIVAISAGPFHTVGLRSDGTVVSVGDNKYGQCNVSGWTDIVAISAGSLHTIGLRSDGTVVAVGSNTFGQCDVSDWKLFRSVDTFEQERKEAQKRYAEQAHLEAERCAEQARLEAERCAEQTRLEAECRAEQARLEAERRARRKAELQNETSALKSELDGLKGMFSGKRRKEIETRLAQIEDELKKL